MGFHAWSGHETLTRLSFVCTSVLRTIDFATLSVSKTQYWWYYRSVMWIPHSILFLKWKYNNTKHFRINFITKQNPNVQRFIQYHCMAADSVKEFGVSPGLLMHSSNFSELITVHSLKFQRAKCFNIEFLWLHAQISHRFNDLY